jgi:hypothetical protein
MSNYEKEFNQWTELLRLGYIKGIYQKTLEIIEAFRYQNKKFFYEIFD